MNRTHELIQKYLDDCASVAELAELGRLLAASPDAADALAYVSRMEAALTAHFPEEGAILPIPALGGSHPVASRRGAWGWAPLAGLAAAVLLLAVGAALVSRPRHGEAAPHDVVSGRILVNGVEADLIPAGSQIEVAGEEAAVIRLADGARAELAPATKAVLSGRAGTAWQVLELSRGGGRFQLEQGGRQFRVHTPVGTLTARDTEFSIELRPADEQGVESMSDMALLLTVAVLTGQVEVQSKGQNFVLAPGESWVFAADEKVKEKKLSVAGKVTAVSADGRRITLEGKAGKNGGEPVRTDLRLTERTKLIYFGVEKGADKPTVGYLATAWLDDNAPDTAVQVAFGAKEPHLAGHVAEVSADGRRLTLVVQRKGQEPLAVAVQITDRTRLGYAGVGEEADRPAVGYGALVWLKEDPKDTAVEIQFSDKKKKVGQDEANQAQLTGTVSAVSADGQRLTVLVSKKDGTPTQVEFALTPKTKVGYFGVAKDAEKPTVGYHALVWLEKGSKDTAAVVKLGKKDGTEAKPKEEPQRKEEPKPSPANEPKQETPPAPPPTAEEPRPPARNPLPTATAIDREVDRRLAEAKVPASPPADDAEFVRRVTLDITGRIPTSEQAVAFLDSKDPDKRRKLIDALLASPAYGQHFGAVWRNLMIRRDAGNGKKGADTFTPWLDEQFNRNRGWDAVVRDLLTVEGEVARNPQAGFIMANSEGNQPQPNLLAAATSRLFLGVQLQCAECHNHPFAPWKQTDFWGTAAFFTRVGNGGKKGPPFVLSETAEADAQAVKRKGEPNSPPTPGAAIAIPNSAGKAAGQVVRAKFLDGPEPALGDTGPYRPHLAAWVTSAENPYFANAAANRLWAHFFGRGLVHPVDNFHEGNPPSHPELLQLLADEFRATGHDWKHLIRCVCNSQAYQRTSRPLPENEADKELFSHMTVKVMSPGVFYDALAVAMAGDPTAGAKAGQPGNKGGAANLENRDQFVSFFSMQGDDAEAGEFGHGIPQFLRLMNAPQFNRGAPIVDRLARAGASREQVIEGLYLATLARRPTAQEVALMSEYVARRPDAGKAYAGVLWILLNSSEFVLNH